MSVAKETREGLILPMLVFLGVVSTAVGSLGAPLLVTIADVDDVSLAASQWTLTISLLIGAVASPLLGRLADGPHRRPVILSATAVVCIGCVLSALPLGFGSLMIGRAMQGVGLGLVPLAITAARDALPAPKVGPGIALLGVTTAAGLGVGYPVAGLVTEYLGLAAAFWFGAAVSAVAFLLAAWLLPSSSARPRRRVDVTGAVLLGIWVTALLLVCSQGPEWGWTSPRLLGTLAAALVVLVGWTLWELRTTHPLVELRLLRHRSVLAADITVVLVGLGIYPLLSLVVRYVQAPTGTGYGFGASTLVAGLMLVPYSIASFAASKVTRHLLRRMSLETVVAVNCLVLIAAMVLFLTTRANLIMLLVTMALAGFGVGCIFAVHPAQIVRGAPAEETGSATSFYQVLRYIGYSAGSALSATLLISTIPAGDGTPTDTGYEAAAWFGIAALVVALAAATILSRGTTPAATDPRAAVTDNERAVAAVKP
ncbi:MFS transporter [Rhodococcus sp. NPDC059968]|uniref:MFS transporter n=1 Tax=Rhodococcus sp. NPDC059968 TaxID=3347017 RepID=UPI00366DCD99